MIFVSHKNLLRLPSIYLVGPVDQIGKLAHIMVAAELVRQSRRVLRQPMQGNTARPGAMT